MTTQEGEDMRQLLQEHRTLTASPATPRLRAAVVGLGRQATDDHIPGLLASDGAVLAAVCDENPDLLRERREQYRVTGYTDFREMFAAE
jgi:predicted dehydrogenase